MRRLGGELRAFASPRCRGVHGRIGGLRAVQRHAVLAGRSPLPSDALSGRPWDQSATLPPVPSLAPWQTLRRHHGCGWPRRQTCRRHRLSWPPRGRRVVGIARHRRTGRSRSRGWLPLSVRAGSRLTPFAHSPLLPPRSCLRGASPVWPVAHCLIASRKGIDAASPLRGTRPSGSAVNPDGRRGRRFVGIASVAVVRSSMRLAVRSSVPSPLRVVFPSRDLLLGALAWAEAVFSADPVGGRCLAGKELSPQQRGNVFSAQANSSCEVTFCVTKIRAKMQGGNDLGKRCLRVGQCLSDSPTNDGFRATFSAYPRSGYTRGGFSGEQARRRVFTKWIQRSLPCFLYPCYVVLLGEEIRKKKRKNV